MIDLLSPEAGANAVEVMIDHLTPPLAAGARRSRFAPDAAGVVHLPEANRPTVLVALKQDLEDEALAVTAALAGAETKALVFAAWSEAGSTLILPSATEHGTPLAVTLVATLGATAVPVTNLADLLELIQLEGNMGRLLAVLGDEKIRIRRELRRVGGARLISTAVEDALDRMGAEVGVPRLESAPAWDAVAKEIVSTSARETDEDYRKRLAIWRPWVIPTPAAFRQLIEAVDSRVTVTEAGGGLSAAVLLVEQPAAGSPSLRTYMLERIKLERLVPFASTGSTGSPRPMSADAIEEEKALRKRLADLFEADPGLAVAPMLAAALDRAGRVLKALGAPKLSIKRAQDDAGGSRFELGLGVALRLPNTADAEAFHARLVALDRPAVDDAQLEAIVMALAAAAPGQTDRTLDWLWRELGFGTVHRLNRDNVYLSHLMIGGLTVFEAERAGNEVSVGAIVNAPGDPARTASLEVSIEAANTRLPGAFELVDPADAPARLTEADAFQPSAAMESILVGAGIPATSAEFPAKLRQMPPELWALLKLSNALDDEIRAGHSAAITQLHDIAEALEQAGIVSLMPVLTADDTFLVAGADALPGAGLNAGERAASTIRWKMVPIAGKATLAAGSGSTNKVLFDGPGLVALVVFAYVRGDGPDPYEVRIDAREGESLDLVAYERVMNALERACPVGVEINTWRLRRYHVDLDGDGAADPLPPTLARHYRRFRMPRMRGLEEPDSSLDPSTPMM